MDSYVIMQTGLYTYTIPSQHHGENDRNDNCPAPDRNR